MHLYIPTTLPCVRAAQTTLWLCGRRRPYTYFCAGGFWYKWQRYCHGMWTANATAHRHPLHEVGLATSRSEHRTYSYTNRRTFMSHTHTHTPQNSIKMVARARFAQRDTQNAQRKTREPRAIRARQRAHATSSGPSSAMIVKMMVQPHIVLRSCARQGPP